MDPRVKPDTRDDDEKFASLATEREKEAGHDFITDTPATAVLSPSISSKPPSTHDSICASPAHPSASSSPSPKDDSNSSPSSGIIPRPATTYPEGTLRGWLVVFGSWCGLLAGLGTMNTMGSFQAYISQNQLRGYSESQIGWIFSVYAFLAFASGVLVGPLFDKYGPGWLLLVGSVGVVGTMFAMAECSEYWHFLLVFGILGGISASLLFTPAIAAIGHWFHERRGFATGVAVSGGAIGGVVYPLILSSLIPRIGFPWTTRVLGFLFLVLCIIACLLIRSRLPPDDNANAKPDFRIFRDPAFAITVAAIWFVEWALFIPLAYITSYALYQGFDESYSYLVLSILNIGSIFGRFLPGFYADKFGRYNTMILTTVLATVSVLAIWLPFGHTRAGLVVFAVVFGFASGSNISLTPVCVGQLCRTENYGRYYATCYTVVSVGCLTGIPIVGAIVRSQDGQYWGLVLFTGICYGVGLAAFVLVRVRQCGWSLRARY